jgi:hypothetical protein
MAFDTDINLANFGSTRLIAPTDIEALLDEHGADTDLGLGFASCPGRFFAEENHSVAMRLIAGAA